MAFNSGEVVWTPTGQASGCIEMGAGCRGRTGVSQRMGGMVLDCSHRDCPLRHQIADAELAMDVQVLAKLPKQI